MSICVSDQLKFEESVVTQLSALNSQEIVHLPVTNLPFVMGHYNQPVLNQYLQTWSAADQSSQSVRTSRKKSAGFSCCSQWKPVRL